MRLFVLLCLTMIQFIPGFSQEVHSFMTFNIRYNNPNDGENAWPQRIDKVNSMLKYHQSDVMGVQEALPSQVEMLKFLLNGYDFYGQARSQSSPEYCGIFYLRHKYKLLGEHAQGTFWLSETPGRESVGWDAALPRIASWVRLKPRGGGTSFLFVNTHFDHQGQEARRKSVEVLAQVIDSLRMYEGKLLPVVLLGDFNARPNSDPILLLTNRYSYQSAFAQSALKPHGPASTWTGWKIAGETGSQIDHIFVAGDVGVLTHATLSDSWSGSFPSDHMPVRAELIFEPVKYLPQAHAHNDYEHDRPLLDALEQGFSSVEVDVWLADWGEKGKNLLVSHNKPIGLDTYRPELMAKSLEEMYLIPLSNTILAGKGWVYPFVKSPLYLMIDVKGKEAEASYETLMRTLEPYQWMLKGENPPVKIFLSGNRNIEQVLADIKRWVSIDGRPDDLEKGYNTAQMPFISQRYGKILDWRGQGKISEKELAKLKKMVAQVHAEGKKLRLWASPEKEEVWKVLLEEGVDVINTDELERLRKFLENDVK